MDSAKVGFMFIGCLVLGTGIGLLFGDFEMGGLIGFGSALVSVVLFRKK